MSTYKNYGRGIKTTNKKINEVQAVTVMNRLGQLTITLPRIDDKKRWAGFPGIAGVAKKIARMIPDCYWYVEPFAGTAKVFQELNFNKYKHAVLNDKSKFIFNWLTQEFTLSRITNMDFVECIRTFDTEKTFFMIDGPWFKSYYDQDFSCFNRKSVKEYDEEIIEICKKIKGKFLITSRKENKVYLNSGFKTKLVQSIYPVSGHLPKVLVTKNY